MPSREAVLQKQQPIRSARAGHDFRSVTEQAGEHVSAAQISRLAQRYYWAGQFCHDKDVAEVACGAGQGLGYLASVARSVRAGDITPALVQHAKAQYGARIEITELDAQELPYEANSLDVVILFEAIYYLPSAESFIRECRRVLRPEGALLLATANCDLFDFNPSPFSVRYYGVPELTALLGRHGFEVECFGGSPLVAATPGRRVLRLVKRVAVMLHLIPGSMRGKRWLKRLVFGKLVVMPNELRPGEHSFEAPTPIDASCRDRIHQVLYCAAKVR